MGMAFEVTKDDVFQVMRNRLGITDVEYYSREVEDAWDIVANHADEIEAAALMGDDLDQQTEYAHDKVEEILREEVYG